MDTTELKEHFNEVASGSRHDSYEERRWHTNPRVAAQADATLAFIKRFVVPIVRTSRSVIELGPGPGTWTRVLAQAAPNASFRLIDISSEMLARARAALPADVHVEVIESDFLAAPLPENSTDFFFSSRAIEYVEPKERAVHIIAACLERGACGVIITKMPKHMQNWLSGRTPSVRHQGQINPRALAMLLESVGLSIIKKYPVTFSVPLAGSATLDRLAQRLLGRFRLNPLSALFAESYALIFRKL